MAKSKTIILFIFLILAISSLTRSIYLLWNNHFPDFSVFYYSSLRLFNGMNPYTNLHIFTQVNYPPITLMFFYPLLLAPFIIAEKIWLIFSVILFLLSLYLIKKIYKLSVVKISLIFFWAVIAFPFKFTLGMGQINMLLLFSILCFLYFLSKKREFLSGLFFSLAIVIKLIPIIFVIELFFLKRWKILFYTAIVLLIFFVVSDFLSGKLLNFYYAYYAEKILVPLVSKAGGEVYYNQTFSGFAARINLPVMAGLFIRIIILFLTLLKGFKNRSRETYIIPLFLTGTLLINSFAWQHQLILLIIPFGYFLAQELSFKKNILLLILYILISFNIKNPAFFNNFIAGGIILSHAFFGLLGIWTLLILETPNKILKIK